MRGRVVGLVFALVFCVGAGTAQAASSWRIEQAPSPYSSSWLASVSCWSPENCVAVGGTGPGSSAGASALAEERGSGGWKLLNTQVGSEWGSYLDGVSCPAAGDCLAVGAVNTSRSPGPLLEQLSGGTWHVLPAPWAAGSQGLYSVSCPTTTWCMAVGPSTTHDTLAFDGTSWSIAAPLPQDLVPNGVSCSSPSACEAVGWQNTTSGTAPADAHWNGSVWTLQPTAPLPGLPVSWFQGVSCLSASFCSAVGAQGGYDLYLDYYTLGELWGGTSWTAPPTGGSSGSDLMDVSCAAANSCQAVGYTQEGARTLAWSGSGWQYEPNPASANYSVLDGVSCPTTISCMAVGAGPGGTLVERYSPAGPSAGLTIHAFSARTRSVRRSRLRGAGWLRAARKPGVAAS